MFIGQEMDSSCWNCGSKDHRFTKCPKPLNVAKIAAGKARFLKAQTEAERIYQACANGDGNWVQRLNWDRGQWIRRRSCSLLWEPSFWQPKLGLITSVSAIPPRISIQTRVFNAECLWPLRSERKAQPWSPSWDYWHSSQHDENLVSVLNHFRRTHSKKSCRLFQGVCLDTGAQRSVIGKPQALAYCNQH